jgi:hypothetical protein
VVLVHLEEVHHQDLVDHLEEVQPCRAQAPQATAQGQAQATAQGQAQATAQAQAQATAQEQAQAMAQAQPQATAQAQAMATATVMVTEMEMALFLVPAVLTNAMGTPLCVQLQNQSINNFAITTKTPMSLQNTTMHSKMMGKKPTFQMRTFLSVLLTLQICSVLDNVFKIFNYLFPAHLSFCQFQKSVHIFK